jgi:hypothetical protein
MQTNLSSGTLSVLENGKTPFSAAGINTIGHSKPLAL